MKRYQIHIDGVSEGRIARAEGVDGEHPEFRRIFGVSFARFRYGAPRQGQDPCYCGPSTARKERQMRIFGMAQCAGSRVMRSFIAILIAVGAALGFLVGEMQVLVMEYLATPVM